MTFVLRGVVVSQPTGTYSSVVQWDFGKTVKGGRFQQTGPLGKLPGVLLHALGELQTVNHIDSIDIERSLSFMVQNEPRMGQTYRYQGADHDQLFEATYDHEGDGAFVPILDVLQAATLHGWEACSGDICGRRFGVVEQGWAADLVTIDGDPTGNIGLIRKLKFVMKDGEVYK
ncbi:hypothetical protein BGZ60DRAFT_535119 [Tricladium varicosporioides]|nr:hypothetical protein BGZ60DRAFT_535119 [Hymenoscyphus varicosporioides]